MKIEQKHCDALMSGQKCKFWDDEEFSISKLVGLDNRNVIHKFQSEDSWYENCEPIKSNLLEAVERLKPLKEWAYKPEWVEEK